MDVGELEDELAVVEINSFSAAGLYCCEKEPVVREVSRIALEMWEEQMEGLA